MKINFVGILIHFLAWLIVPIVIFACVADMFFWFAAIGSIVILCIYYFLYPAVKSLPYAAIGLAIAIFVGYSI
jgi:hypothetical protein